MDLKKYIFPKQKYTESLIRRYAIYSTDEQAIKIAPTRSIFDMAKLERMSSGLQARVFKHKEFNWVIKEGRWDLEVDFFGTGKIPLNIKLMEKFLGLFSFSFRPRLKEVLRQYNLYLKFAEYFGFFEKKGDYFHPNINEIHSSQRHLRNSLLYFKPEIEKHFHFKINDKIDSILLSDVRFHNFLPKEYLLYGKSLSPENGAHYTYFIVQDFIAGTNLDKLDETDLPENTTKQLIVLLYLILLMDYQIGLLPDTRPKYVISQMYNWLLKTDNIMISNNDVKFIDTRWLWDKNDNFVKRGLIIPEMIENLAKGYINFLLDNVD
jgi:hypothetical protein